MLYVRTCVVIFFYLLGFIKAFAGVQLDSSCNQLLLNNYVRGHNCLLEAKSMDCFILGGMNTVGAGVVGAGIGAQAGSKIAEHAAKAYYNMQDQLGPNTKNQVDQAFKILQQRQLVQEKAIADLQKLQDQTTEKITGGKYKSYASLKRATMTASSNAAQVMTQFNLVDQAIAKEWQNKITNEKSSELKIEMERFQADGRKFFDPKLMDQQFIDQDLRRQLAQVFSEDYRVLKPYYDKINALEENCRQLVKTGQKQQLAEERNKLLTERYILDNYLAMPENQKLKLVDGFFREGVGSSERLTRLALGKQIEDLVGKENPPEKIAEKARATEKARGLGKAGGAAVGGASLSVAVEALAAMQGQISVGRCRDQFQFSDDEIAFLGNDMLFSTSQAINGRGLVGSCQSLLLTNPQDTVEKALAKFGGMPVGLCNMIKNEMKQMDALVAGAAPTEPVRCEQFADGKFPDLNVRDSGQSFSIGSLSYSGNYVDMRTLDVRDAASSKPDIRLKNEIQQAYTFLHPSSDTTMAKRPDLLDASLDCASTYHEGLKKFCKMRPHIFASRIGFKTAEMACALKAKPSLSKDKASTKAGSY